MPITKSFWTGYPEIDNAFLHSMVHVVCIKWLDQEKLKHGPYIAPLKMKHILIHINDCYIIFFIQFWTWWPKRCRARTERTKSKRPLECLIGKRGEQGAGSRVTRGEGGAGAVLSRAGLLEDEWTCAVHSPHGSKEWNWNSNLNLLHWFSNLIQK